MKPSEHIYAHPLYYEIAFCRPRMRREIDFVIDCHKRHRSGAAPKSVFDNGCGTGLHLEKFAKRGIRVTGYDASPQMVEYAASRLARCGAGAYVFEADLRDFETPRKSDMAFAVNGVFQYLLTVKDVVRHLQCVAKALKTRGLYLVCLPAPQELIAHPPGSLVSRWSESRKGITVDVDYTYRQQSIDWPTQTFSGLARIGVREAVTSRVLWMPYKYRVFFLREIETLVALSGCFEIVEIYGAYDVDRVYRKMRKPRAMNVLLRKTRGRHAVTESG